MPRGMFYTSTVAHCTGKEFDCGIYITAVQPSSKAAQAGIKVSMIEHKHGVES